MDDGRNSFWSDTQNSYITMDPVRYLKIELQMKEEQRKVDV